MLHATTWVAAGSAVMPFATALAQGGELFAAVRRGKAKPGSAAELAKRINEGALPVLTSIAGFKAYYVVYSEDDTVTTLTVYTTKAGAEEANKKILPWIKEHLAPLLAGPPEGMEGSVIVSKTA
jgi:hypothetical protein